MNHHARRVNTPESRVSEIPGVRDVPAAQLSAESMHSNPGQSRKRESFDITKEAKSLTEHHFSDFRSFRGSRWWIQESQIPSARFTRLAPRPCNRRCGRKAGGCDRPLGHPQIPPPS